MAAQKLTPAYRRKIDLKLAKFRQTAKELRFLLHELEMPYFMDLLGGGLGLSAEEISILTHDDLEEDGGGRN